jgi:hypothetical protein
VTLPWHISFSAESQIVLRLLLSGLMFCDESTAATTYVTLLYLAADAVWVYSKIYGERIVSMGLAVPPEKV